MHAVDGDYIDGGPTGPIHDFQTFRAESHADWFRLCLEAMHAGDEKKASTP